MHKVEGNHITMTRGDSLMIQVEILTAEGEPYQPVEGDSVRFALKSARMSAGGRQFRQRDPVALVNIPIDSLLLVLDSTDTAGLDFGEYKYDIEITQAGGWVTTFIANADLTLTPEVH